MAGLPSNPEIAAAFALLGDLLEIDGASRHRVLAYRRAAERIGDLDRSFAQLALDGTATELPDIGDTLQAKTVELVHTGDIAALATLRERVPEGLAEIARIRGLGPKRAKLLFEHRNIRNVLMLREALAGGGLDDVPGFGAKTIASIAAQLAQAERIGESDRVTIGRALPLAEQLARDLSRVPGVERVEIAGGLRRGAETVHDIDLAVATRDPAALTNALDAHEAIMGVVSHGEHRVIAKAHSGLLVEVRSSSAESFGNLLQHLTGSAAHNTRLRERAVRLGMSVSEHGITGADGELVVHATEREVYAALGLREIPPELREDDDELELAEDDRLPDLVTADDLRGELHAHTDWSDGRASLEEMAQAAMARGYEYLVITDHSPAQAQANGLDSERRAQQRELIQALDKRLDGFRLLQGIEVDILRDGALDCADAELAQLDFVVASFHSGFTQSREVVTKRLIAAIEDPYVDVIGHPTGRKFGSRPHSEIDLEAVVEAAARTSTALEINSQPRRLDLDDRMARRARQGGAMISIGADAHSQAAFDYRRLGMLIARRAGLEATQVLNTLTWDELAQRRRERIEAQG